jgi:hypothetical protein
MVLDSCSKTELNQLEGNWRLFWINDLSDPNIYVWQFDGGTLTILKYDVSNPTNPGVPVIGARATYKTSTKFTKAKVTISDYSEAATNPDVLGMVSNGTWTIDKIDNEVLRLSTTEEEGSNGSYVIREFTRDQ